MCGCARIYPIHMHTMHVYVQHCGQYVSGELAWLACLYPYTLHTLHIVVIQKIVDSVRVQLTLFRMYTKRNVCKGETDNDKWIHKRNVVFVNGTNDILRSDPITLAVCVCFYIQNKISFSSVLSLTSFSSIPILLPCNQALHSSYIL